MIADIAPSKMKGVITPPSSKSYGHRLLIAASLQNEDAVIENVNQSNDIRATIECLEVLGKEIHIENSNAIIKGQIVPQETLEFTVLESGSTFRFFIPIALVYSSHVIFHTSPRLLERGIEVYENVFEKMGIKVIKTNNTVEFIGQLKPGNIEIPGNISSQYVTGFLFALPLLKAKSTLKVLEPIESSNYIDMTLDTLKKASVLFDKDYEKHIYNFTPKMEFKLKTGKVEPDYSNAAFLEALNYIDGEVEVQGFNVNSCQADTSYLEFFKQLKNGHPTINIQNNIDLGPILFVVAALNNGAIFEGTRRLAIKESHRALVMQEELAKLGIELIVKENSVEIVKGEITSPTEILESHNDHRVAMSLAVLLLKYGGSINNFEAINKSYPTFINDIRHLKGQVHVRDK